MYFGSTSSLAGLNTVLREAKNAAASEELIGQFGIGFYSTFMVADKVELLTRKAGESEATRWASSGEGTYTIESVEDAVTGSQWSGRTQCLGCFGPVQPSPIPAGIFPMTS
jgi:HSP90 family molecular chaperone